MVKHKTHHSQGSDGLIYVKFNYEEAMKLKKVTLMAQANSLKIARSIKNYQKFRLAELRTKARLERKLKDTLATLKKLQKILPEIKIPEILQHDEHEDSEETNGKSKRGVKSNINSRQYSDDLESQLRDIKDQLRELDR